MPAAGEYTLSRDEVMMYLALADLHRRQAADLAGVSLSTFCRAMKRNRIEAPRYCAKLRPIDVQEIRALLEKHSQREVARMKDLSRRTVEEIASYGLWRWVK